MCVAIYIDSMKAASRVWVSDTYDHLGFFVLYVFVLAGKQLIGYTSVT